MMLKLVIGDWSNDGHGRSKFVYFESNLPQEDIKAAYLATVRTSGVGLHEPDNGENLVCILGHRQENTFPIRYKLDLEKAGVDFFRVGGLEENETWGDLGPEGVAKLFLEMVRASRPDFVYEIVEDDTPCVNGFWSKDFNHHIGYGVFDG